MNLEEVLALYTQEQLPDDIRVVTVPVALTAYGDWVIVRDARVIDAGEITTDPTIVSSSEDIHLEECQVGDEILIAGWGEKTRLLVLGTGVRTIYEARPIGLPGAKTATHRYGFGDKITF